MAYDFTFLGYSLLAAHLLLGTIFVTGGYFFIKKIVTQPKNVSQISNKSFQITSELKKDEQTISRAA